MFDAVGTYNQEESEDTYDGHPIIWISGDEDEEVAVLLRALYEPE